jgi:hypothetical protein
VDFSLKNMKTRRKWNKIFQVVKKELLAQNLYLAKISSQNAGKIKAFSHKGKLKEFVLSIHTLSE